MVKIIDNFLNNEEFSNLENSLNSPNFPWYYAPFKVAKGDNKSQFYHLYVDGEKLHSKFIDPIKPIMKKLNIKKLMRVKANFTEKKDKNYESKMHIDFQDCTTAIFYLNTNNGHTKFRGLNKIESKKNRVVIFDSNLYHCSMDCTDEPYRIVFNFNYI